MQLPRATACHRREWREVEESVWSCRPRSRASRAAPRSTRRDRGVRCQASSGTRYQRWSQKLVGPQANKPIPVADHHHPPGRPSRPCHSPPSKGRGVPCDVTFQPPHTIAPLCDPDSILALGGAYVSIHLHPPQLSSSGWASGLSTTPSQESPGGGRSPRGRLLPLERGQEMHPRAPRGLGFWWRDPPPPLRIIKPRSVLSHL